MATTPEPSLGALSSQNDALWEEAYEKFKRDDPELYERLQSIISKDPNVKSNVGLEQQLGDLLLRKLRIMEDKQWVFYWRKKAIKIGPQFDKIVKLFKLVKPIGDTAAVIDPVHAGIPWTCVSVLLPLILNHSEEQEAALNGLQEVVEIVQQFTSFDWDHLNIPKEKSEKQLKGSIVTLYWKILRYEATAIHNFSRHTLSRYAASIARKDDWKTLLSDVEVYKNNFMTDLQLNDSQNQKRFESELRELILGLDRTNEKNLEIIQWVSDIPYISQHYTARQLLAQYPHAGEWIIEKYTRWLNSAGVSTFWIRGTIGTGKTSIISTIIESFYSDIARQDEKRMVYFYCISPTTSSDVIRSLVSQLAWTLDGNAIEPNIISMFNATKPPDPTIPKPEDWSDALLKLCQRLRKVIIVIDALDECKDFSKLLATLKKFQVKHLDSVKLVFSSRLNVDVEKVFSGSDGVILAVEDTSRDMSTYIENEVRAKEEDIECDDETAKRQIIDRIVLVLTNFAGGMFKWVTLQLAIMFPIETQTFLPENIEIQLLNIKDRNLSLEQSLNDAYETVYMMNTKPGAYNASVLKSVCKWLLCCKTPLPAEELLKVIEISLDHDPKLQKIARGPLSTKIVLHCCSNFVIQSSEGTFRFAHLSVEEYLISHCGFKVEFQTEECHLFVMKMCLNLLVHKRVDSGTKPGLKRGSVASAIKKTLMLAQEPANFLAYSISYWAYHSNKATSEKRCKDLLYKRFALGATISPSLKWWYTQIDVGNYSGSTRFQIMDIADRILGDLPRSDKYPSKSRLRMLGAAFNLPELIQNSLDKYKESIDEPLRFETTPLLVAIRHGSPDSVKYLLDCGANPHLISSAHRHHIKYANMGRPIADEDMVYWVIAKGGNPQENLEERLQVEEILLSHERSRQAFIEQLERHLEKDTHSEPLRALETLYRAADETPISAKILEYRIKTKGLGELADVLHQIDEETINDKMVLGVIRFDSYETVEKLFELKQITHITEDMIRCALKSSDSRILAYFMTQSNSSLLRRELVIDEKPGQEDMWKVILDVKGKDFVDQEVFDSLFSWPHAKSLEYILTSCGIEMINSSHIESIAELARLRSSVDTLNFIIRLRGSLDGLITEEAALSALKSGSSELYNLMLVNVKDQSILRMKAEKFAGERR
ncbi:hypothetical protein sscle_01g007880 [Sclerotinia sclerotiorum 1980 UF-70]|uniref:Uncharacterized protein n=1 Tax=Sclerotinia sclerotiorum (strain ATCC 18683 / 1980 / Ss-1) TaxID=665079 RepID=A0A1D9PTH3_SCLS1|nr:hypothetical protein sscle_01g007880 [Sclerotinia sclerotiorum 1980 UF-70]